MDDGSPEPHFLLVGDGNDLPALRGMLSRLPVDAFGQLYLEVASAIQIRPLPAPDRISVTWLCRDEVHDRPGAVVPRGELAVRAVNAWIAEWMPEDAAHSHPYIIWIGCTANPRVSELYRSLSERLGETHLHHP